jgi:hypothetical protein
VRIVLTPVQGPNANAYVEVLESELAVAAVEEWAKSRQVEQRADRGGRLSSDQSRKINRLSPGGALAKDSYWQTCWV